MNVHRIENPDRKTISDDPMKLGPHIQVDEGVSYRCIDATGFEVGTVDVGDARMIVFTALLRHGDTLTGSGVVVGLSPDVARAVAAELVNIAGGMEQAAAEDAASLMRRVASR